MPFPIRCYTCGKVLADKYAIYQQYTSSEETENTLLSSIDDISEGGEEASPPQKFFLKYNITRYCCKRMFLGYQPSLEESLLKYSVVK